MPQRALTVKQRAALARLTRLRGKRWASADSFHPATLRSLRKRGLVEYGEVPMNEDAPFLVRPTAQGRDLWGALAEAHR